MSRRHQRHHKGAPAAAPTEARQDRRPSEPAGGSANSGESAASAEGACATACDATCGTGGAGSDLRPLAGELLGTAMLLTAVVGSGIMGAKLAGGNTAIALLANTIATGAALVVLILALGPVSGAHFNPVVSVAEGLAGRMPMPRVAGFVIAQVAGGLAGVALAHAMFAVEGGWWSASTTVRNQPGQWVSEAVATAGLLFTIRAVSAARPAAVPAAVGLYITSAYWFTASTSFANPAVTVARCLTDTFAGIRPTDVPGFLAAQIVGASAGVGAWNLLQQRTGPAGEPCCR